MTSLVTISLNSVTKRTKVAAFEPIPPATLPTAMENTITPKKLALPFVVNPVPILYVLCVWMDGMELLKDFLAFEYQIIHP